MCHTKGGQFSIKSQMNLIITVKSHTDISRFDSYHIACWSSFFLCLYDFSGTVDSVYLLQMSLGLLAYFTLFLVYCTKHYFGVTSQDNHWPPLYGRMDGWINGWTDKWPADGWMGHCCRGFGLTQLHIFSFNPIISCVVTLIFSFFLLSFYFILFYFW